uniref:non-specific serine/threonine protein kinase n=1 Tax=Paramormyrops kingsleyae TaxID=1676925 RepID=A0A3B3R4J7_9TELE
MLPTISVLYSSYDLLQCYSWAVLTGVLHVILMRNVMDLLHDRRLRTAHIAELACSEWLRCVPASHWTPRGLSLRRAGRRSLSSKDVFLLKRGRYRDEEKPDSTMTNKNGMVMKIQTPIRTDSFKSSYDVVGKTLGRGKFAVVKKCVEKSTGKEHAAKYLKKMRRGQDCRSDIIHEIAVLEYAKSNPFVVSLHEVYETTKEMILVLEYAAGGEIFDQCVADETFPERDVIRLTQQILKGVACLHRNNVVHLDLKPQNILLTSSQPLGDIRIVDFGLSRCMDNKEEVREIIGTPEYVAPEVLNYEALSPSTDMWSIGVLTYVMLTGSSPFLGDNKQETFLNISQGNADYSQDVFEGVSSLAIDFIKTLLVQDPRERPSAEDCLAHPWLMGGSKPPTHLHSTLLPSQAEPETSQSESDSEPESPVPSRDLLYMTPYCSSQREMKAIRGTFSCDEPFPSLPEIPQKCVC